VKQMGTPTATSELSQGRPFAERGTGWARAASASAPCQRSRVPGLRAHRAGLCLYLSSPQEFGSRPPVCKGGAGNSKGQSQAKIFSSSLVAQDLQLQFQVEYLLLLMMKSSSTRDRATSWDYSSPTIGLGVRSLEPASCLGAVFLHVGCWM